MLHFANWIFEFDARFKNDLILEDPNSSYDEQKNPYLGHFVKIVVKKSPNERTNCTIRYPIKYGRKNGKSNWVEKEIFDFLLIITSSSLSSSSESSYIIFLISYSTKVTHWTLLKERKKLI